MTTLTDQTAIESITDVIQTLRAPMQHEGEFNLIKPLEDVLEYLQERLNTPMNITVFTGSFGSIVLNNYGKVTLSTNTETMHVDLNEKG